MIIFDLKQDFYEPISNEVLLQQDNIKYTIVPVSDEADIKTTYDEHKEQIKHFLFINCGGNTDLEFLEPYEDSNFYIVDSHRPLELSNIFKDQVKIIAKEGDATLEEIPDAEKIIEEDDEDADEEDEDDPDEPSAKRQRTGDQMEYLEKRAKKKKWMAERERIMEEYYEYSYHGTSVAIILYNLAWNLTKDNNEVLWLAIVGLTEQYLFSRIDREKYFDDCSSLRDHVLRHNVTDEENVQSIDCMKIAFENELRLTLYRHWSIFESFLNSQYTACWLRLFTLKGNKKLHEFFADIGVPISQCKQKYSSMDIDLRGHVKEWMEDLSEKYGLDDFTYGSFTAQYGFKNKFCAEDVVCTISALLEYSKDSSSLSDNFLDAINALSRNNLNSLTEGLILAKKQISTLVNQVRSFIDSHQIVCVGPFLYAQVQEGSPNAPIFARPTVIGRLARFALEAYSVMTKNKKARSLPFILAVPFNTEEGTSLIVGVPPVSDTSLKSFFGAAFRQAGDKTKSRISYGYFDPTVIEIKTEDRSKFLDNLSAIMA